MRAFRDFSWKDTNLRVAGDHFELITQTIMAERKKLEQYIRQHPAFRSSLTPVDLQKNAPSIARRMAAAARLTGLGPMASVAGTLAQMGVKAAMAERSTEAIVENGGDMYIFSKDPVTIGIYAGKNDISGNLAFRLNPEDLPLAICSSSSHMGHSMSFGQCDLATVIAKDAALADSVATLTCNQICKDKDVEVVLNAAGEIPGVSGILAVKEGKIGIWGKIPELVRNQDHTTGDKITKDRHSNFQHH